MNTRPATLEEVQEVVRGSQRLLPRGGGTKPALSTPHGERTSIDISQIRGITAYEPEEFTFTALAGTPLLEVRDLLASHGQFLAFDPPMVERGATLGGTVATGLSGPGRYQYGGVRDFLLGVRFVDSEGEIVHGGGKVVKNVAGYDLPKLMVGSMGQYGILAELTFKVFPKPEVYASLRAEYAGLEEALQAIYQLCVSPLEIHAIDLRPIEAGYELWIRLAGSRKAMPARLSRLRGLLGKGVSIQGLFEEAFWREVREMEWVPEGWALVRIPLTPGRIPAFETSMHRGQSIRHYSGGGQVGFVALPHVPQELDGLLAEQGLSGQVLYGPPGLHLLGTKTSAAFAKRVKAALDPAGRFGGA